MSVGLKSLTVYCTDLEKTKQFYEAIGLELHKMQSEWSAYYYYLAKLENNQDIDVVLGNQDMIVEAKGRYFLTFTVDDVAEILKKLESINAQIRAPLVLGRPGCTHATVEDPDGRLIRLISKNYFKS